MPVLCQEGEEFNMKAISIRQPWAWLIVTGKKDIENRNWKTNFRGPVLIHASATMTRGDYEACCLFIAGMPGTWRLPAFDIMKARCGGIVGMASITDCVTQSDSPWFVGDYGFVMDERAVLPFHGCKGKLGFFDLELPSC